MLNPITATTTNTQRARLAFHRFSGTKVTLSLYCWTFTLCS